MKASGSSYRPQLAGMQSPVFVTPEHFLQTARRPGVLELQYALVKTASRGAFWVPVHYKGKGG